MVPTGSRGGKWRIERSASASDLGSENVSPQNVSPQNASPPTTAVPGSVMAGVEAAKFVQLVAAIESKVVQKPRSLMDRIGKVQEEEAVVPTLGVGRAKKRDKNDKKEVVTDTTTAKVAAAPVVDVDDNAAADMEIFMAAMLANKDKKRR